MSMSSGSAAIFVLDQDAAHRHILVSAEIPHRLLQNLSAAVPAVDIRPAPENSRIIQQLIDLYIV